MTLELRDRDLGWGFRSKPRTPLMCYFIFLTYADILPTNFPFIRKHLSADLTKGSLGHFSSSKFQKRLNFQDFACSYNRVKFLLTCNTIKGANCSDKIK